MRNELISIFGLIFFLSISCMGDEEKILTREEAVRMLPYSVEGDAPGEHETFLRLVEIGESAYPALAEELLETNDSSKIASIVGVFVSSKGDKTMPLQAMIRFVELHGREYPTYPGLRAVLGGIGNLGGEPEKLFLRQYLDVKEPVDRHVVEDSIKLIDKRQEAMKREAVANERREHRDAVVESEARHAAGGDKRDGITGAPNARFMPSWPMAAALCLITVILALITLLFYRKAK